MTSSPWTTFPRPGQRHSTAMSSLLASGYGRLLSFTSSIHLSTSIRRRALISSCTLTDLRAIQNTTSSKMEKSLTPQAFASNNLDRSMTDRRDTSFVATAFPNALFLVVAHGKVLVTRTPERRLRWFTHAELKNMAYDISEERLSRPGRDLKPCTC